MKFSRPARLRSWHLNRDHAGDLDAQIANMFATLASDISRWQDLTSLYHADLFCGLFLTGSNQGLALMPETMAAMAQRGLTLSLDIYDGPDRDGAFGESSL